MGNIYEYNEKKIQKIWRDVTSEKGSKYFRILKKGTFHQK